MTERGPAAIERWLDRAVWRGRADCDACAGSGWRHDGAFVACVCQGPCGVCGGSGYVAGGLEACGCRVARERVAMVNAAGLPYVAEPEMLADAVAAWFARVRPEDGWPWLTVAGVAPTAVAAALSRLVTGVGVPVDPITASPATWRRVVFALDGEALGANAAAALDACAERGTTLVFVCARAPFAAGGGAEREIGEAAATRLWANGEVVEGG